MPDETYELPGVISAKSPLMVCVLTEPLVVTRRLTDAPATLPMSAMTHPPLLLGEPLAATPAKEKVVTSPQDVLSSALSTVCSPSETNSTILAAFGR